MTDNLSTPNHAETENCALMYNKNRKDVVLAVIFRFVHLKVKDIKDRMLAG